MNILDLRTVAEPLTAISVARRTRDAAAHGPYPDAIRITPEQYEEISKSQTDLPRNSGLEMYQRTRGGPEMLLGVQVLVVDRSMPELNTTPPPASLMRFFGGEK